MHAVMTVHYIQSGKLDATWLRRWRKWLWILRDAKQSCPTILCRWRVRRR